MRIGILTYWTSNNNYGQILQCYALQKFLRLQGHEAFLIRYLPHNIKISLFQKIKRNLSVKKLLYRFSPQKKRDKELAAFEHSLYLRNVELDKIRKFDDFKNNYINASQKVYNSMGELRQNPPEADVYICGSDQVWNNSLLSPETSVWYLNFGERGIRRIAYAASIGRDISEYEKKKFKQYLLRFNAISVREKSSLLLCESLGIRHVQVTLDPTLLLPVEEYRKLESAPQDSGVKTYLFMYVLNVSCKDEIYWDKIKAYLSRSRLDFKIVCSSGYMQARELVNEYANLQATLPEWLFYIDNSSYVMTTSFHGVVFCIKMHKPFLVILLTNRYAKGNDRIISLLEAIGLSERIFNPNLQLKMQIEKPINWEMVDENVSKLQQKSFEFLKNNLK